MNKAYRLIWNRALGCWIVASELASRGRKPGRRLLPTLLALSLSGAALADTPDPRGEDEPLETSEAVAAWPWPMNPTALLAGAPLSSGIVPTASVYQMALISDTHYTAQTISGNSLALVGSRSSAVGTYSAGFGNQITIRGDYATAVGDSAQARQHATSAVGYYAQATGYASTVMGHRSIASGEYALALGERANAAGLNTVALGSGSVATAADTVSVGSANLKRRIVNVADGVVSATSTDAVTGKQLYAVSDRFNGQTITLGENARPYGGRAIVIGVNALVDTNGGIDGIAIGTNSRGGSQGWTGGVAVGGAATADNDGLALGYDAHASAVKAVALGRGSIATVANTVSVGSDTIKRKIVNVADGVVSATSTDAVTGRQLHAVADRLDGPNIVIGQGAAAIAGSKDVIAMGTNAKAGAQSGTGGIAIGASTTSSYNGVALGYNAHAPALDSVALGAGSSATESHTVSVGSATTKRRIVNMADGALSAASAEAVTGKQLFATNQNVTTATNTANTAKATADAAKVDATAALSKANLVSGLIGQVSAAGNVRVGAQNAGTVLDVRNGNGAARTLSGVAPGALHSTSSEAVNGAQLDAVNDRVELHAVAIGVNRLEIGVNRDDLAELREAFDSFEPDLSGVVRFNPDRTLVDLDGAGVTGLAAGEISATSRDAVNGAQLFGTNERVGSLEQQQRYVMVGADPSSGPARAAEYGVAVGADATAAADGSTAVGSFATALGENSVALGRGSHVSERGVDSFALGTRTRVRAAKSLSIGADSVVLEAADRSVALGNDSVATEADTLSVGNTGLKRRIVNAGRGRLDDDVTTLAQLREAVTALGGGASIDAAGGFIDPKYVLSGGTFGNVGAALTSIDSKVVSNKSELDTLDSQYKALVQNDRSIRHNEDRSVVDFGGARVTGVAAGSLKADSRDGVNGAQLFATNERVGGLENKQRFVMVGANGANGSAHAEGFGVAVGGNAAAGADGATAVGSFATALGTNAVALGRGSYVASEGRDGFALGSRTRVQSVGGLAIGSDADVMSGADQSVALGTASVAKEAHTVSVGSGEYRRRIVSVAQGIKSDDATTVSQLRGALAALGGGADLDANGNVIGPRYAVQGSEYGSFGDAITALDGSVGDNKRSLDTLDSRFQRLFQESPSANADGPGRLSFGGAQGMVLGNVADGLIGQGSRDAVNGGQLWAVKQDLQGQIDALDPAKGEPSGSPLAMNDRSGSITPAADGGSNLTPPEATPPAADPGTVAAQDPLVKAEGDNAVAVGTEGKERQVKHVAEGRADTDAANVRQVNDALERANAYTDSAVASVNQRLDQVDKRISRMAAISSAQSAMAMNTAGLATANRLGAGVGYSEGESAMAVGYQRVLTERGSATFSLNGAFTNSGEKSVGVGVGIGW
jgi:autotransporter adhesin